jgi:hypothetical protein
MANANTLFPELQINGALKPNGGKFGAQYGLFRLPDGRLARAVDPNADNGPYSQIDMQGSNQFYFQPSTPLPITGWTGVPHDDDNGGIAYNTPNYQDPFEAGRVSRATIGGKQFYVYNEEPTTGSHDVTTGGESYLEGLGTSVLGGLMGGGLASLNSFGNAVEAAGGLSNFVSNTGSNLSDYFSNLFSGGSGSTPVFPTDLGVKNFADVTMPISASGGDTMSWAENFGLTPEQWKSMEILDMYTPSGTDWMSKLAPGGIGPDFGLDPELLKQFTNASAVPSQSMLDELWRTAGLDPAEMRTPVTTPGLTTNLANSASGVPTIDLGPLGPMYDTLRQIPGIGKILPGFAANAVGGGAGGTGGGTGSSAGALPAIIGALLGATQGQPAPISTTQTPWAPAIPYMQNALQGVQTAAGNAHLNLPDVPQITPFTGTMSPEYIQQAIEAALSPVTQTLQRQVLPQINANSAGAGALGGTRQGVAQGLAVSDWEKTAGNIAAGMRQNYDVTRAKEALDAWTANTNATQQTYQNQVGAATANATFPINTALSFANAANAAGGGGRSTVTPLPTTPWWQTALGGALAADTVANKVFSDR